MELEQVASGDNMIALEEVVEAIRRSRGLQHGEQLSPPELLEALKHNKVPLLSLDSSPWSGTTPDVRRLLASDAFREALAGEAAHYAEAHAEYVRLAQRWAAHALPCLCFKSAGLAPAFPYTSDNIDLLVPPSCARPARAHLRALGYVEMTNTEEPQKWLFRRFVAGRNVSLIHLHTRVAWDEGFLCEDALWARARRAPDDPWVGLPGREDAVLINLAHALIENKALCLHDLLKLRAALGPEAEGLDWGYLEGVAARRGWDVTLHLGLLLLAQLERQLFGDSRVPAAVQARAEGALPAWGRAYLRRVQGRPPQLPFAVSFALSKGLFFAKVWGDRELAGRAKPAQTVLALARGLKERSGLHLQSAMLLSLSGVDGAGKSSHARALHEAFAISHVRSRIVWTRVGATPLLRILRRVRKRLTWTSADRPAVPGQRSFSRRRWKLRLWAVVASVDYAVWLLYIRWRLLRGEVVIADRYLPDFEIELGMRLQNQPRLASALCAPLRWLAPRPKRAYLLHVTAERALQRAAPDCGDLDFPEMLQHYDALNGCDAMCVCDGTLPFEELATELVHDALSSYMANFKQFARALFFSNPQQLNPQLQQEDVAFRGGPHD